MSSRKRSTPTKRQQDLARAKRRIEMRSRIIRMETERDNLSSKIREARSSLKTI